MQTNLPFNVMVKHFTSNSTPFPKKDRRHYVNTLKLGPSLSAEKKANVPTPEQRYSIKPPTEGMDFAVKSSPIARTPPPPPPLARGLH